MKTGIMEASTSRAVKDPINLTIKTIGRPELNLEWGLGEAQLENTLFCEAFENAILYTDLSSASMFQMKLVSL